MLGQAKLFSGDSMTSGGASGLVLHQHWQVIGALEAVAGVLLLWISTAHILLLSRFIGRAGPSASPIA